MHLQTCTEVPRAKVGDSTGPNATLAALRTGELKPATGSMMGRFKVSGDLSVAVQLQRVV